ncbi:MAG TPA: carboxypeptidase-like regulatory domain-containing protein [Polyangia bacterium]|nr:carboxypeptidase-like regulatory domain-containing protein [Polyangia bacterium]
MPTNANAVLTVPSMVPGRPDLVYQSATAAAGGTTTAMLTLPQDAFSLAATLSLIPLPPSDQQVPVYPFSVTVSSSIAVTLPAGDVLTSGQLLDSLNRPPATFVAKVFQNGVQVSNAPLTQADGSFQLLIPAAAAAGPLTLELLPTASDPSVISNPFTVTGGGKLGTITLPAYVKADSFSVAVTNGKTALSGVSVRAQASLDMTQGSGIVSGTAQYAATGRTDSAGNVGLPLLPGPIYAIAATPPAGSPYASGCVPMVKTVSGASSNGGVPPNVSTVVALMRPLLKGTVRTATGMLIPNVSVSATGTPDASPPCAAPAALTASTTTDATGTFQLPIDPGTYQIDYDPPAGSAAPRLTESAVTVSGTGTLPHDMTLPAAALVIGSVRGGQGEALSSAVVSFFQVRCTGPADCQGANRVAPLLVGKALTDPQGRFRMVVPAPAAP